MYANYMRKLFYEDRNGNVYIRTWIVAVVLVMGIIITGILETPL
jgi:hypothetical protein